MVIRHHIATTSLRDGTEIGFSRAGDGPVLVLVPGWLTHLELSWAIPPERRLYEALAHGRTLIRFDLPGCGLSAPARQPPSMPLLSEALGAVLRAVDAARCDLLGVSLGAAVAAAWAAEHPETVSRLVLYGGWCQGSAVAGADVREHVLGLVSQHWGLGSDVLTEIFAPDADRTTRAAFTQYQRSAATPQAARALLELAYELDICESVPQIVAPTLVLHRDHDRAAPVQQGRELAERIPGARFELLSGRSHLPYIGDVDAVARAVRRFLGLPALRPGAAAPLTPRQREVAALIAEGLTNRQIAEQLSITERTAESHVERIRDRLGFRSRSQIAVWLVAGGQPN